MDSSDYLNYQKTLKQAEINYCNTQINKITGECEDLAGVKTTLEGYIDDIELLIISRASELFECFNGTLWSGNRVQTWIDDIERLDDESIKKLRGHIESNKESLGEAIRNKISEQLELSYRINQLQCEIQYIDMLIGKGD